MATEISGEFVGLMKQPTGYQEILNKQIRALLWLSDEIRIDHPDIAERLELMVEVATDEMNCLEGVHSCGDPECGGTDCETGME